MCAARSAYEVKTESFFLVLLGDFLLLALDLTMLGLVVLLLLLGQDLVLLVLCLQAGLCGRVHLLPHIADDLGYLSDFGA